MSFKALEKLHRLHEGYIQAHKVNQLDILLIYSEGKLYGFKNYCPHQGVPLTHGSVENGAIRCPLHGFEFRLKDGRPLTGISSPLESIPLVYDGNSVGIEYDSSDH
jgi:3-phenylpropionate/trans-cinnamate dioxygenase ferredoxin subunit